MKSVSSIFNVQRSSADFCSHKYNFSQSYLLNITHGKVLLPVLCFYNQRNAFTLNELLEEA